MNPTTRSRSSDNLEKYSPSSTQKVGGDGSSAVTRRLTGDGLISHDSDDKNPQCPAENESPSDTLVKTGAGHVAFYVILIQKITTSVSSLRTKMNII